jgi:hypothetical protein
MVFLSVMETGRGTARDLTTGHRPEKGKEAMKPFSISQIIDRKRYDTDTATLLSGDDWWDGHNFERGGTQTFLYRTPKGAYFTLNMSQWQGANDHLEALTEAEAIELFEAHAAHDQNRVSFEVAFPGVEVDEA